MPRCYLRALLVLLFLAPSSSFGQTPRKKVLSGYIREAGTGQVIGEARIQLLSAMGTPIAFAYSDRNGAYEFDNIGGDCYVAVQREGYEPIREIVRLNGSDHVYKDILLRLVAGKSASKSINPVSERELSIPRKAHEAFDKGVQLIIAKSDYRGAVAQFAKAIAKYPSYYEAYAAMGLAQNKMGDAQAAEAALRKSINLSAEKYPQAMIDLASMLNGRKRFTEAEPLLRKAIALDALSWRGQFELAVALAGQNRFMDAVGSAAAARDLKPDNPQIYLLLYNLHIQSDDFPAALKDTDAYLKLAPNGPMADRVRKLKEQLQKAGQASQKNSVPSSDAMPPAPAESPVGGVGSAPGNTPASETGKSSNFTPVDAPALSSAAPAVALVATPAATPSASPVASTSVPVAPPEESSEPSLADPDAPNSIIPPAVDEVVPEVAVNVPCSLSSVLHGAGRRAEQLLSSLQKFDASERVEHYKLNAAGVPGRADVRSFDYVVTIFHDSHGGFALEEYRNGAIVNPSQFPAGIVTANLSAHALIFHPSLSSGFRFSCEGLGDWKGHPAWLIHFEEKPGKPTPFRSYVINGVHYPLLLTGRAWIDERTHQVLRLESDLLKPVEKIHLTREHISIEYGAVRFRSLHQQLWLPQSADLYVDLNGHRFYRRHTFTNFKLFSTDTTQQVSAPKESYCFTNTSNLLITGVLNTSPVSGMDLKPASLALTIPAKSTVCKTVGAGMDVNIPLESVASATFAYDGPDGSVEASSLLPNGRVPEVIANRNLPVTLRP
ncbi:MAG: tetratricopeptide repeat protein [Candidatus Acidiferrum sp.]